MSRERGQGEQKIKVLFPIYGLRGGGAERVVVTLANRLDRRRFEPVIVLLYLDGEYLPEVRSDVRVVRLYEDAFPADGEPADRASVDRAEWLRSFLRERLPPDWIDGYRELKRDPRVQALREGARLARGAVTGSRRLAGRGVRTLVGRYRERFGVLRDVLQTIRVLQPWFDRMLARERPDCVVSHLLLANFLTLRSGPDPDIFKVLCIHNTLRDDQVRVEYREPSLGSMDAIVAVSETIGGIFRARFGAEKVRVIHNPHDLDRIRELAEAPLHHPWFSEDAPPVVVGIGRLCRQKNFSLLVDAVADLNAPREEPVRLVLLGEGPCRRRLERRIRKRGQQDHMLLMGWCANPFRFLARADLFALSSDWEGLPNTLIEAMACGVPVVSTDCESGPREILQDGRCGLLVPCRDRRGLAEAIAASLDAPAAAATMRDRARVRARDFHVSEGVARYERLILEGVEGKRKGV